MQTSKECVYRAIEQRYPDRIPLCLSMDSAPCNQKISQQLPQEHMGDIITVYGDDPDFQPLEQGYSQWGYKLESFGETMGEVCNPPLANWENFQQWKHALPDFTSPKRFQEAHFMRKKYPDKFIIGGLTMMMMEIINLRGYENCMIDYYEEEDNLNQLIDCIYDAGKKMVDGYADAGLDGVIAWEDWGLQYGPMISYDLWMNYYYERMKDFINYVHSKNMKYLLHSCGHILYLMDTFIEMGVDVIQMDQQMNMGLDTLSKWKDKICFWCPIDIQHSPFMTSEQMESYTAKMIHSLGSEKGGFMYKIYAQPAAIHISPQQLQCELSLMKNWKISPKNL